MGAASSGKSVRAFDGRCADIELASATRRTQINFAPRRLVEGRTKDADRGIRHHRRRRPCRVAERNSCWGCISYKLRPIADLASLSWHDP